MKNRHYTQTTLPLGMMKANTCSDSCLKSKSSKVPGLARAQLVRVRTPFVSKEPLPLEKPRNVPLSTMETGRSD
jgi:hypothetical protein